MKTTGKSNRGKSITNVYLSCSSFLSPSDPLPSSSDWPLTTGLSFKEIDFLNLPFEDILAAASTFCLCFSTAFHTRLSSQSTRGISPISCFLNSFSSLSSSSSSGVKCVSLMIPFGFLLLRDTGAAGVVVEENPSAAL